MTGVGLNVDSEMLIAKILLNLPEQYKHFSVAWDSTPCEDRTLENLRARLLKEEEKMKNINDEVKVAFKAYKFNGTCNNRGKVGHKRFECWLNPENRNKSYQHSMINHEDKSKNQPNSQSNFKHCMKCNKDGHTEERCWSGRTFSRCKFCHKTSHPQDKCRYRAEHENNNNQGRNNNNKVSYFMNSQKMEHDKIDSVFVIDSGATCHLTHEEDILCETRPVEEVSIGCAKKGSTLVTKSIGKVEGNSVILTNVSYVPDLSRNLLSVSEVTDKGGTVVFDQKGVKFVHGEVTYDEENVVLAGAKHENGLYTVNLTNKQEEAMYTQDEAALDWHKKLGHLNFQDLKKLPELCDGVSDSLKKCKEIFCEPCVIGKLKRKPFKSERTRALRPLQIIHTDICGKISPETYDGEKYVMTCLDDFTHFLKVYLLHTKDEAEGYLKEYIQEAEAYFNLKTSVIRLDNGGEYSSVDFKNWCRNKGIQLDYTIPHSPELNGKAERVNLTLFNKVRAMLFQSKMDNKMWGFAVLTAAYLFNRSPTTTVETTPAEKWFGKKPNLSNLREFGQTVYTKNLRYLKKLDD